MQLEVNFLGKLLHPIIKFGVIRNWKRFTKDDRPVRKRRGELRQKGYIFDMRSPVNHLKTIDTYENGVSIKPESNNHISNKKTIK